MDAYTYTDEFMNAYADVTFSVVYYTVPISIHNIGTCIIFRLRRYSSDMCVGALVQERYLANFFFQIILFFIFLFNMKWFFSYSIPIHAIYTHARIQCHRR